MGCRECIDRLVEGRFRRLIDAIRVLVAMRKLGLVDRLGFALDQRVAIEALEEIMRAYRAIRDGATEVKVDGERILCCEEEDGKCLVRCPSEDPSEAEIREAVRCIESPCWRDFTRALVASALAR